MWFKESPLKAIQKTKIVKDTNNPFNRNAKLTLYSYLLPGFKSPNFKTTAWIETGRINVVGLLKTKSNVSWSNHETVVINTDQGIRIVDLSFDKEMLLTIDEWLSNFAPDFDSKNCVLGDDNTISAVSTQIVYTQQFHQKWDNSVPKCAYKFGQRLDAKDTVTGTNYSYGTPEEQFLSSKFRWSLEEDLTK